MTTVTVAVPREVFNRRGKLQFEDIHKDLSHVHAKLTPCIKSVCLATLHSVITFKQASRQDVR